MKLQKCWNDNIESSKGLVDFMCLCASHDSKNEKRNSNYVYGVIKDMYVTETSV